jgi:hypothetical protein
MGADFKTVGRALFGWLSDPGKVYISHSGTFFGGKK